MGRTFTDVASKRFSSAFPKFTQKLGCATRTKFQLEEAWIVCFCEAVYRWGLSELTDAQTIKYSNGKIFPFAHSRMDHKFTAWLFILNTLLHSLQTPNGEEKKMVTATVPIFFSILILPSSEYLSFTYFPGIILKGN